MLAISQGEKPTSWPCGTAPRQREAYTWFITELANLRTAFRWAADHGDLDAAAAIATYAAGLGALVHNYEPIAWAEELIEPARAVGHPRLAFLYVMASACWMAGRIEEAVGYADAAQLAIASGRHDEVHFGGEAVLGTAYAFIGRPERWSFHTTAHPAVAKVPIPVEFRVNVAVSDQQCPPTGRPAHTCARLSRNTLACIHSRIPHHHLL